ncbi:MAG TPA: S-methyl-5'-thioadenosine phosphorylase [Anaerolineaceae bacterium]|nr:S-methyl-5'-thioadenosine phosphorylase [Anaerolineaceae bacterium]
MNHTEPVLGIIGGSGLYQFEGLTQVETLELETPFGKPSSPIVIGNIAGKRVAFLARHGIGHFISPTEVNYRANIYAFKALGVPRIVSISACGSLRDDYAPGEIVIPDQLVDFTRMRARSFFGEGLVAHIGVADPFCPDLSAKLFSAVNQAGVLAHKGGTLITIEGPRFSTRAESNLFRSWGMSIIGMTACPEAFLAREAEICYATMAHVTDYDVWHVSEEAVSVEMVVRTLLKNTEGAQKAVISLVKGLFDTEPTCGCSHALETAIITNPAHVPGETRHKLTLLTEKYIQP